MKQILLTQNKFALIDDEDFERVNQYKWYFHKGYAKRGVWDIKTRNNQHQTMHTFLMGNKHFIDHKNGNGIDNRKRNLRVCTTSQNLANKGIRKDNRTGYKGVKRLINCGQYQARIGFNKKEIYLGNFYTKEEAAAAYNKAAIKFFGEFAKINII